MNEDNGRKMYQRELLERETMGRVKGIYEAANYIALGRGSSAPVRPAYSESSTTLTTPQDELVQFIQLSPPISLCRCK
jgi:hypothetical protein